MRDLRKWRPLEHFAERSLGGLFAVLAAGTGFGLLLLLVRFQWDPLYGLDHGIAERFNDVVSRYDELVTVLQAVTDLGGRPIMLWLVTVAVLALLIRRRHRLAWFLVVTGVGALVLDPALKTIVGRLRPIVDIPVASAPGNSFPSGHALGSMVSYGALLLVFLPAIPARLRKLAIGVTAGIIVLVGLTRVALGVHYVSDVFAGWLLGAAWLGVTGYAFRLWRREIGRPVPAVTDGLEPEAAEQIKLSTEDEPVLPHPFTKVGEILTGWVLVFGVLFVLGYGLTHWLDGSSLARADVDVTRWFADRRTPVLNEVSWYWSKAGDTHAMLAVSLVFCPLILVAVRSWRPVLFVALVMFGELSLFLATSAAVDRPRPPVPHLDGPLPTSSFPSGHIAATMCLYTAIALLVWPRTDRWWRWATVLLAVVMPAGVALSRMYRGMHHPTDLLGAMTLTALWVGLLWYVVRPNEHIAEEPQLERELERPLTDVVR